MASSSSPEPTATPLALQCPRPCPRSASNRIRPKSNTRRKAYRHTLIQCKVSNFFSDERWARRTRGGGPKRCHRGASPSVLHCGGSGGVEAWLRGRRCRGTEPAKCVAAGSAAVVPSKLVRAGGRRCRGHEVRRSRAAPPSCLGSFG